VQLPCKRAGVERNRRLAALKDGPLRHSDRGRAERSSGEPRRKAVPGQKSTKVKKSDGASDVSQAGGTKTRMGMLDQIIQFYLSSGDFNGIPIKGLLKEQGLEATSVKEQKGTTERLKSGRRGRSDFWKNGLGSMSDRPIRFTFHFPDCRRPGHLALWNLDFPSLGSSG